MLPPFANAAHFLMMTINMNWPIPCQRHDTETDGMGEVLSDTASHKSMTLVPSSTSSKGTLFGPLAGALDPEDFMSSSAALKHMQQYNAADMTTYWFLQIFVSNF
jgi:hypothetical protein